jgi:hypothetical protein
MTLLELLNISQLRPGQTIAKAVTNSGGAVLCPPGFKLTEAAIRSLQNAGIESVIVEEVPDPGPGIQERIDALHNRFEGIDDPIMLQLKATIENRLQFLRLEQGGDAGGGA